MLKDWQDAKWYVDHRSKVDDGHITEYELYRDSIMLSLLESMVYEIQGVSRELKILNDNMMSR